MSDEAQRVRAILAAVVQGVPDAGLVYDYRRWAISHAAFIDLFKTTIDGAACYRGWMVGYVNMPSNQTTVFSTSLNEANQVREHVFKLYGYYGLKDADASEKAAQALAIQVMDALSTSVDLRGFSGQWGQTPAPTIDFFDVRLFGNILCHVIEITQRVRVAVTVTTVS